MPANVVKTIKTINLISYELHDCHKLFTTAKRLAIFAAYILHHELDTTHYSRPV